MNDQLEYDENGNPIYQRSLKQNNDYHRNVVGQCVYWYKKNRVKKGKPINISNKDIALYFHNVFKDNVLPIFGETSTTKLTNHQIPEFIAECFIFLSSEIDVFEHGEQPNKNK
jgi:hypothetical protein